MDEIWRENRKTQKRKLSASVDRSATRLYDKLNPDWENEIRVSKAECIRQVEIQRGLRSR